MKNWGPGIDNISWNIIRSLNHLINNKLLVYNKSPARHPMLDDLHLMEYLKILRTP